jgi:NOL1/NOP2/fmu family ribosome biogenesis protein
LTNGGRCCRIYRKEANMVEMHEIKKTLEKGVSIAKEGVTYAAARAEDLSLAAALRLRIFALRRRMERHLLELGETVYRSWSKGADIGGASVKAQAKKIAALEREIDGLFKDIEKMSHKSTAAQSGRGPAKKKPAAKKAKQAPRPKR